MKTKSLIRWGEKKTLDIFDKSLKDTPYRVSIKIRLIDVIGPDKDERLSSEENNFLRTAHFDFVVFGKKNYFQPVFAVEFDGPHHLTDENQIKRDIIKNRLCMRAKLPLLRVGHRAIEEQDQITLLEFMLERFIAWQREGKKIHQAVQEYLNTLESEEFQSLTESPVLDPSIDPTVIFDFSHPFPGIIKVVERLYANFGIFTTHMMSFRPGSIYCRTKSPLVCYTMPLREDLGGHNIKQTYSYTVFKETERLKNLSWSEGKLTTPGINVMFEGTVDFSMQWTLPVVEDYKEPESGFEYFLRKGKFPYNFSDIPGIHIPDIASWFCEYLTLREVEKWAHNNLPRRFPAKG